jgi:hypothetical protein
VDECDLRVYCFPHRIDHFVRRWHRLHEFEEQRIHCRFCRESEKIPDLLPVACCCCLFCNFLSSPPPQADCLLDALTSVIVFWRYYRAVCGRDAGEHMACIYLGILLVISACAIIAKAIADIITQPEAGDVSSCHRIRKSTDRMHFFRHNGSYGFQVRHQSHSLSQPPPSTGFSLVYETSLFSWMVCTLFFDESYLMMNTAFTAVNTLLSGVFCVVVAITVLVIDDKPELWYLDPVEGGVFALLMAIYGLKCIIDNSSRSSKDLEKSISDYILIP